MEICIRAQLLGIKDLQLIQLLSILGKTCDSGVLTFKGGSNRKQGSAAAGAGEGHGHSGVADRNGSLGGETTNLTRVSDFTVFDLHESVGSFVHSVTADLLGHGAHKYQSAAGGFGDDLAAFDIHIALCRQDRAVDGGVLDGAVDVDLGILQQQVTASCPDGAVHGCGVVQGQCAGAGDGQTLGSLVEDTGGVAVGQGVLTHHIDGNSIFTGLEFDTGGLVGGGGAIGVNVFQGDLQGCLAVSGVFQLDELVGRCGSICPGNKFLGIIGGHILGLTGGNIHGKSLFGGNVGETYCDGRICCGDGQGEHACKQKYHKQCA